MFFYSERPGTPAAKKLIDDIPENIKKRRLQEIVDTQVKISEEINKADIGKTFKVLIEGDSKRSILEFKGRNSQNKMINFPKKGDLKPGDYTWVQVTDATSGSLRGIIVNLE
jgi:tRNA-2-methylthio-N6-dimethylallyladenosine synthase